MKLVLLQETLDQDHRVKRIFALFIVDYPIPVSPQNPSTNEELGELIIRPGRSHICQPALWFSILPRLSGKFSIRLGEGSASDEGRSR